MYKIYRDDIDGIRGIAVISVILFHLGYLPNGYLGVDVFFVISGYLITSIVFREVNENTFSILKFYEKRIRRIIPLVLFTTLIAFLLGLFLMLPDDLENMCQSIFASNFSANNILMYITSGDYWAVKNDFKPLMHTWSLGVEEQFYLLYPVIFFVFKDNKKKFIFPFLLVLTCISLFLFFTSSNSSLKFYFLQFRFFELSIGGICAIYFGQNKRIKLLPYSQYFLNSFLFFIVFILFFKTIDSNDIKLIMVTLFSAGVLVLGELHFQNNTFYKKLLTNRFLVGVGKISFSLYMWHQIIFAFVRYSLIEEMNVQYALLLIIVVAVLSVATYYFIEKPFRDRSIIKTKPLLIIVGSLFLLTSVSSFYIYAIGGIIKDVPELGLKATSLSDKINFFDSENNIHIKYNEDVRILDKAFVLNDKVKILVIGNSFARDFANVLLESKFKNKIELSYYEYNRKKTTREIIARFEDADYIFIANDFLFTKKLFSELKLDYNIDSKKVWVVGIKDFGNSNGIFYNKKKGIEECPNYRTFMKRDVVELNNEFKSEWGNRYIDLIALVADSEYKVLVFTPNGKFISQDTFHFTKDGASFFAELLNEKLQKLLELK
jgi:peptidoglycan/LPS O-acetylase OafA/YrhL